MIYHILCITKNQFTAQPQRDKRASSIHKNRGSTKQINYYYNTCCFALDCLNHPEFSGHVAYGLV